jgi:hypothetical protein
LNRARPSPGRPAQCRPETTAAAATRTAAGAPLPELRRQLEKADIQVEPQGNSRHWKLRVNGIVLNYWPNSGTCYVYGRSFVPKSVKALIKALIKAKDGSVFDTIFVTLPIYENARRHFGC